MDTRPWSEILRDHKPQLFAFLIVSFATLLLTYYTAISTALTGTVGERVTRAAIGGAELTTSVVTEVLTGPVISAEVADPTAAAEGAASADRDRPGQASAAAADRAAVRPAAPESASFYVPWTPSAASVEAPEVAGGVHLTRQTHHARPTHHASQTRPTRHARDAQPVHHAARTATRTTEGQRAAPPVAPAPRTTPSLAAITRATSMTRAEQAVAARPTSERTSTVNAQRSHGTVRANTTTSRSADRLTARPGQHRVAPTHTDRGHGKAHHRGGSRRHGRR